MKGPYTKFTQTQSHFRAQKWFCTSNGVKERAPLPYTLSEGQTLLVHPAQANVFTGIYAASRSSWDNGPYKGRIQLLHNRTYNKWLDKARNNIQMGANIAESNQTLKMLTSVLRFGRKPFIEKLSQLGDLMRNRRKAVLRDVPGAYLAFHFGIEPLYKDVFSLLQMFELSYFKSKQVTASSSVTFPYYNNSNGWVSDHSYKLKCRISGFVKTDSVELATLADIGVLNPISIAWELVPFSFVVDWFIPVGLYLQQFDSLVGRSVTNAYSTWIAEGLLTEWWQPPSVSPTRPEAFFKNKMDHFALERKIGVPSPVLSHLPMPWSVSATRAATSISLLARGIRL